jgi:hypothetical protein
VGGKTTEMSAPSYEDRFSHKITILSNNDSDSYLRSDEEGVLAHQAQGTMHLGVPPLAKNFSILALSPLQAALQAAHSRGENTAHFKFYSCSRCQTLERHATEIS